MKKLYLALFLFVFSASVNADVGVFFDGTSRYAKTGVIQPNFPDVPLVSCPSFKACEQYLPENDRITVIFSDINKMLELYKKEKKNISSVQQIHTTKGRGFKIIVFDVVFKEGKALVLLQVKNVKKKTALAQSQAIAQALVNEMNLAYARAGQ